MWRVSNNREYKYSSFFLQCHICFAKIMHPKHNQKIGSCSKKFNNFPVNLALSGALKTLSHRSRSNSLHDQTPRWLLMTFKQMWIKAGTLGLGLSSLSVFLLRREGEGKDVGQSCRSGVSLTTSLIISAHYSDKHSVSAVWQFPVRAIIPKDCRRGYRISEVRLTAATVQTKKKLIVTHFPFHSQ